MSTDRALGRHRPMSTLPARDIAEMRVAELLSSGGCPLCNARLTGERRAVDAVIGEAVNDVGVRRRLDVAGGYCSRHASLLPVRERARRGGTLGSAILLGSVVRRRLDALDQATAAGRGLVASGRRTRGRVAALRVAPACPICADVASSVDGVLTILVGRLADPMWAASVSAAQLCLDDVLLLWEITSRAGGRTLEAWRAIAAAQTARLRAILATADGYIDHSGHDRQAELTDAERAAVDALVQVLAGDVGEHARDAPPVGRASGESA